MRLIVLKVLAVALVFAFTGGLPAAVAFAGDGPEHCRKPAHACCGETLTRCACADGAHDGPTALPAMTGQTHSKSQLRDAVFLPCRMARLSAPTLSQLRARSTAPPGRLLPLPILHVALLI